MTTKEQLIDKLNKFRLDDDYPFTDEELEDMFKDFIDEEEDKEKEKGENRI